MAKNETFRRPSCLGPRPEEATIFAPVYDFALRNRRGTLKYHLDITDRLCTL